MIKACNLQKGHIVDIGGQPCRVLHIDVQTPSARGANTLYKVSLAQIPGGQKVNQTFKGNDSLEEMEMDRRPVSFLYRDRETLTFMDGENYEQYTLSEESLGDLSQWLVEGMEGIGALLLDGNVLTIELPAAVDLEIVETAPAIKGATAQAQLKPATLETGIQVMVPPYLTTGEIIRVDTRTGKFVERVRT